VATELGLAVAVPTVAVPVGPVVAVPVAVDAVAVPVAVDAVAVPVAVPMAVVTTSTAPMSQFPPAGCGRVTPRWSTPLTGAA